MSNEVEKKLIVTEEWPVTRHAEVYEITLEDGRIRYNIQVRDEGRDSPFINMMFGSEGAVMNFLTKKLMGKEE